MPSKVLIKDAILNEFFFDAVFHATREARQRLTPKQLKSIKTPKSTKRFAVNSTVDEKAHILSALGVSYCIMFFPSGLFTNKSLKDLFAKYEDIDPKKKAEAVLQDKVMAVTDRQVTLISQLMANQCHSDSYLLSRDFHKIGHHILNWEEPENAITEATLESLEYLSVITKLGLNFILAAKNLTVNRVNNDLDINILMYLITRRNRYVTKAEIDTHFRPYYKVATITSAVKRLLENLYIDKHPSTKDRQYISTSLGITEAMSFIKKTMNQTLNF